jgi:hypothetical protein
LIKNATCKSQLQTRMKFNIHPTETEANFSNDIDKKVGDKVNLSNSPQIDSHELEIATYSPKYGSSGGMSYSGMNSLSFEF